MRFSLLFFLLLFTCLYLTLAQGAYENCCLKYVKRVSRHTKKNVISYRKQETDGGCNIPAVVFQLKNGRRFCADPKQNWVKDLQKKLDNKAQPKKLR